MYSVAKNSLVLTVVFLGLVTATIAASIYVLANWGGKSVSAENRRIADGQLTTDTCGIALVRAKNFGVLPPNAQLLPDKTAAAADADRATCQARSGSSQYSMIIDFKCQSGPRSPCLRLLKVTDNNGALLFNRSL